MRYENVLQIYWTKGFFFGGNVFYFNHNLVDLVSTLFGFSRSFYTKLVMRFELTFLLNKPVITLEDYHVVTSKALLMPLNVILSQISSVNALPHQIKRFNIIRLYLIKSYRGRSHALGKPVRGQRTWSNSWNSYNVNKILRVFVSETVSQLKATLRPEKINYKLAKKKYGPSVKSLKKKPQELKKKLFWF